MLGTSSGLSSLRFCTSGWPRITSGAPSCCLEQAFHRGQCDRLMVRDQLALHVPGGEELQ